MTAAEVARVNATFARLGLRPLKVFPDTRVTPRVAADADTDVRQRTIHRRAVGRVLGVR